ncbi:MAG: hypothetical protein KBA95_19630, partial [Acidobacteria bacterium]|nr:hypothetical protein [Acidobacteriota bacterium]
MRPLLRRWRTTLYMLSGNTLDRSGPEDIHVPELYKAQETLVPRIEEAILERDPWFRVVARKKTDRNTIRTREAFYDWMFDQAKVRDTVQPAARNMLVCQAAVWYAQWERRVQRVTVRTEKKEWKDGRLKRSVQKKVKDAVTYFGPRVHLVDPFDFIIDTKATTAQDAVYVGHRAWVTVDEIRRMGRQFGWVNIGDELDAKSNTRSDYQTRHYSWPRDPTAIAGSGDNIQAKDGRPGKIELTVLYMRWDAHGDGDYRDYQFIMSGGKLIHEVRLNQHDNEMRPYAVARAAQNGHEFYGIGPFDNAVRLNQHLDRYHQIFLRSAEVAACPMVFAEEDSDLPDSLYKVQPFSVFKGTGAVRFTSIPDGVLNAAPLVLGALTRNIEETVGAFKIQMGQDLSGSTATEATLSLQEGNRRTAGLKRSMGNGLGQLLDIFARMARQHAFEDIEFPVLGKRALDLKRDHTKISPADLIDDVQFEIVGLHSMRTNGMKGTGLQMFGNTMAPFIMANPQAVDQTRLMHKFASEFISPEDADDIVKVPTPLDQLRSQEEENEGLINGAEIEVDEDDPHEDHIEKMADLYQRAIDPESEMHIDVRRVVIQHRMQHLYLLQRRQAQDAVQERRTPKPGEDLPPEAGGMPGPTGESPKAGGMSDAMSQLSGSPGGQTQGETPGPPAPGKQPRPGRAKRPVSQSDNA